jgi:hypothetical protein
MRSMTSLPPGLGGVLSVLLNFVLVCVVLCASAVFVFVLCLERRMLCASAVFVFVLCLERRMLPLSLD